MFPALKAARAAYAQAAESAGRLSGRQAPGFRALGLLPYERQIPQVLYAKHGEGVADYPEFMRFVWLSRV